MWPKYFLQQIPIQDELLADPEQDDLVKGLGGVRKARIATPTRAEGKRGGYRYLYLYLEMRGRIYLLYIFDKRERAVLDDDECKVLASIPDQYVATHYLPNWYAVVKDYTPETIFRLLVVARRDKVNAI
jgi:hypothetical protein